MSKAKKLITEGPLNLDGMPDWIDPDKKRKISGSNTPLNKVRGYPNRKPAPRPGAPYPPADKPDNTTNYNELTASATYPEIVKKVARYTGSDPARLNPHQLASQMMQAMQQSMTAERRHRPQLEQAAIDLVLDMPEFKGAREAIADGELRIEARLIDPQAMVRQIQQRLNNMADQAENAEGMENEAGAPPGMRVDSDEDTEQQRADFNLDIPEFANQYQSEVEKRRWINMWIQGGAINKNFAFHMISDRLQEIDPQILNTYGKAMSIAELFYWMMPEAQLNQMMGSGSGAGGMEEIDNEDGCWVIRASGIMFPVLVQEIAKGLLEFMAHNEDDPKEIHQYVHGKADTLANEQWDIMQGPGVYKHFLSVIDKAGGSDVLPQVYRHIVTLSADTFHTVVQDILHETPEGIRYLKDLVAKIKARNERKNGNQQESLARDIIRED